MELILQQLVYARVEPMLSPRHSAGFQTVYHSPGLDEPTVAEIQRLVGDFDYKGDPRREAHGVFRLQYFWLNDGRAVVTKSAPAHHVEFIDRAGRPGAFICHCLILTAGQFRKIANNPFVLFDHTVFVTEPEELHHMLTAGEPKDKPLRISEKKSPRVEMDWPKDEIWELRKVALLAKSVVASGNSVIFIGDHDVTADVLRAVFELNSQEIRQHCTFNTHADGSEVPPYKFWVLGMSERPRRTTMGEVDVSKQKVVCMPSGDVSGGNSLFAKWLDSAMRENTLSKVLAMAGTVQSLADAIMYGEPLPDDQPTNGAGVSEFGRFYCRELIPLLAKRLTAFMNKRLAMSLASWLSGHLWPRHLVRVTLISRHPLTLVEVAKWLFLFLNRRIRFRKSKALARSDWAQIRRIARRAQHGGLLFVTAVADPLPILGWKREKDRRRALLLLVDTEFDSLIETFEPADFVSPAWTQRLLDKIAHRSLTERQLYSLFEAVISEGTLCPMPQEMYQQVRKLSPQRARRLLRHCGEHEFTGLLRDAIARRVDDREEFPPRWHFWKRISAAAPLSGEGESPEQYRNA